MGLQRNDMKKNMPWKLSEKKKLKQEEKQSVLNSENKYAEILQVIDKGFASHKEDIQKLHLNI